jgi:hypothetical protein
MIRKSQPMLISRDRARSTLVTHRTSGFYSHLTAGNVLLVPVHVGCQLRSHRLHRRRAIASTHSAGTKQAAPRTSSMRAGEVWRCQDSRTPEALWVWAYYYFYKCNRGLVTESWPRALPRSSWESGGPGNTCATTSLQQTVEWKKISHVWSKEYLDAQHSKAAHKKPGFVFVRFTLLLHWARFKMMPTGGWPLTFAYYTHGRCSVPARCGSLNPLRQPASASG